MFTLTNIHFKSSISTQESYQAVTEPVNIPKSIVQPEFLGYIETSSYVEYITECNLHINSSLYIWQLGTSTGHRR